MVSESEPAEDRAAIREVADRLKAAVRAAGGNQVVADKSGVPLRTVNSYLAGAADPKMTKLDRIARACETTVDALLGRKLHAPLIQWQGQGVSIPEEYVPVPYLDVRASAGGGRKSLPVETVAAEHVLFARAWLRALGVAPIEAELLRAEGDSMYPTIHDGDLMLVDRGYGEVVHGKIYALVVHDLVVVKRVNFLAMGGMVLVSDNDRYPSETIRRDEVGELNFQGRIAWYGRAI